MTFSFSLDVICSTKDILNSAFYYYILSSSRIHEEDISRSVCILCNEAMEDRTVHVLFQYNRTRDQFENELQLLQQAIPPAMWMQFDALDPTGTTVFIFRVLIAKKYNFNLN